MPSSKSVFSKERRQNIFEAANAIFKGCAIRANDWAAIKANISKYPAIFDPVLKIYGSEMVVQIISSQLDSGRFTSESNAHLELAKINQPSTVRDRQHDALEQEAAQSEAKALDEASRADLAMHEGDPDGEQIDVACYNSRRTIFNDLANMYERKPDRSMNLQGSFPLNPCRCSPHTYHMLVSISY